VESDQLLAKFGWTDEDTALEVVKPTNDAERREIVGETVERIVINGGHIDVKWREPYANLFARRV
jgi:hypothetical protein